MLSSVRMQAPLNEILRNGSHLRVLRALHEVPRGFGISGREVARRAGLSHPAANTALAGLVDEGLVHSRRSRHADEYSLNDDHVFTGTLRQLFLQEERIVDELREFLRYPLERVGVRHAVLFGSVVTGEATARSDIDLAVEPPAQNGEALGAVLAELREKIPARFGNQLHVVVKATPSSARSEATWRRLTRHGLSVFRS